MSGGTVFVYATQVEARPLLLALGAAATRAAPYPEYLAGDVRFLISGIGLAAARAATMHAIATQVPARIVNCGVAGGLHDGLAVGDVHQVSHATSDEPEVPTHARRYHRLTAVALPATAAIRAGGRLLSRAEPLFDAALRARCAEHAELVDMEGAAIAAACNDAGVDCVQFKAVSDFATDRAVLRAHLDTASASLARAVLAHFHLICHG